MSADTSVAVQLILDSCVSEGAAREFEPLIGEVLNEVSRVEGQQFAVNILLTDRIRIRGLNRTFRGIDAVTDVLSFPSVSFRGMLRDYLAAGEPVDEYRDGKPVIGDIAVCVSRAEEQAREIGQSVGREIAFLVMHGALHLLGYDHEEQEDEEIMTQVQRTVMDGLQAAAPQ